MKLKRRKFLWLGGLTGLGLGAAAQWWLNRTGATSSPGTVLASPSEAIASSTPVATGSELLLRFVAIADSGSGDANQYDVAKAMERYRQQSPYSLVILAGDNIYNNGEIWKVADVFEKPYAPLLKQGVKFRACLGNHDIRTDNGDPQVKYAGFNMPQRYYTFREKAVQFFALDTNVNANWTAQQAWLEKELGRSDAPWKVVFGHHPIYSSGVYGNTQAFINQLSPLFQKYGVRLYINGHEHSYERTRAINGTTYLITGIGGAHLRAVGRSEWTQYSTSRYGFTALDVYRDRMEVKGIGTDHQVFDRGVISA
jgi:acid phosphatase